MIFKRLIKTTAVLLPLLVVSGLLGLCLGSTESSLKAVFQVLASGDDPGSMLHGIIWRIRFPRVLLAAQVGAALSLGGLVFQALLRNPLAEPYILGISGGAAIGAIIGILLNLARFPGVCLTAFAGSMATLVVLLMISSGPSMVTRDSLLLSGVMLNAFCSAMITFLISLTQDARIHNIMFWLMGDMSSTDMGQAGILGMLLLPPFVLIFGLSYTMNLLLMGKEMALSMGIPVKAVSIALLVGTSFMISVTVSFCGLIGFVGLVMPHMLRLILGADHRILVPACVMGGGTFMILCDALARYLPEQGEMPTGVITAMIGAPLFIYLLRRSRP